MANVLCSDLTGLCALDTIDSVSIVCSTADRRLLNFPTRPRAFATLPDPSDNPTVRISTLSRRLPTRPLTCLGLSLINHLGRSKAEQGPQWYHSSRI